MRRAAIAAALCGLALVAACGGGAAQNPHCASSSNCPTGLVCKASECVAPTQCPSTQASCSSNSACGAGSSCSGGCCAPLSAGSCSTSADCKDIAKPHCDSGACRACAANAECSNGTICTPTGACQTGCAQTSNCPSGEKCFTSATGDWCGQCAQAADCTDPTKPLCNGGFCTGCSANADCGGATPVCNVAAHTCAVCVEAQNQAGQNAACTDAAKPACAAGACVACAPSSNDSSGKNAACAAGAPYCTPADACVGCSDTTQCKSGDYCGSDQTCHAPALTGACLGSAATCATSTTALTGSAIDVSARLDVHALAATTITFTITAGVASFSASGPLATTTAIIAAGANATSGVQVHLDASNTNDVVVQAALGGATQTATIHVTSVPPALSSLATDLTSLEVDQQATITVSLTAAPSSPVHVTLTNDNGGTAALGATDLVISGSTDGTTTLTPVAGHEGTVTLHASYLGVTKDLGPISVVNRRVKGLTPATGAVGDGQTRQLTVTLDAAPVTGAPVTVVLAGWGGLGTVNGGNNLTISNPDSSGTFNFVAGSALGVETITATAGGVTKSSAITVQPLVASVTVSPSPMVAGQSSTITVTLDAAAATATRVYLNDYNKSFGSTSKQSTYFPSFVDVAAGSSTATVSAVECAGLSPTTADLIHIGAWLPGSNALESGDVTVCPQQAVANTTTGCPDTMAFTAVGLGACPIYPLNTEAPKGIDTVVTAQIIYNKPATATSQQLDLAVSPSGCGHFKQAGTTVTSVAMTLSAKGTSTNPNAASKVNLTFVPDGSAGDVCTLAATLHGVSGAPTSFSTTARIVAAPSQTVTATDLMITKIDSDQGSTDHAEFVEIYNPTASAIALAGYKLVLVGSSKDTIGTSTGYFDDKFTGKSQYGSIDLNTQSGITSLAAGSYLLLADAGFAAAVPATVTLAKVLTYLNPAAGPTQDSLEDVPAGVFLVKSGGIIDGVTYGGPLVNATATDIGDGTTPWSWPASGNPLDLWEGDNGFISGLALLRIATTGDNNLDWRPSTTVAIGAANATVTGP